MGDSFATVTKSLAEELQNLVSPDQLDERAKVRLTEMLTQVQSKIEPTMKFMQTLTQASSGLTSARIAIAMGIFDAFASNNNAAMTLEELSPKVKGDSQLLLRIMRLLSVNGLAEETGRNKWQLTAHGKTLVTGSPFSMFIIHFYYSLKSHAGLLEFLEETNFQNPTDHYNGPWQHAHNTKQTYFEWMGSGEKIRQESFNVIMTAQQQYRGQNWFEFYPVEDRLVVSPADTVLIDIGGGLGHDTIAFRKKFPDLAGRVILQDLPQVIEKIKEPLPSGLEAQPYDAYQPQPIRGAKAYYLRTVLHDFPDTQALQILGNVHEAMGGDSVLLINENLMPEENISRIAIDVDFIMMNGMASLERTEKQWVQLLEAANFKILKIWRPTQEQMSPNVLFEAVKR